MYSWNTMPNIQTLFYLITCFHLPAGTLQLPWLRFFHTFSSVVTQMPGYNSQRRDTARTLPKLIVLFCVLCVCKCVLYYCHRVLTQLQLKNTGCFIMFSVITNIYNKKTKGPTLMELFTSNISSCQKKLFQFSCGCEQFH